MTTALDIATVAWLATELSGLAGGEYTTAVRRWAGTLGVSPATITRSLRQKGIRRRAPAERTSRVPDDSLRMLAHVISMTSKSKEELPLLCVEAARDVLVRNGIPGLGGVSVSRLATLLRESSISARGIVHTRVASPAVSVRCDHPNQVHFFDASCCPQFFYGGSGITFRSDLKSTVYKNRPDKIRAVFTDARLVVRYAVIDMASGAFYVDYVEAPGERAADAIDFLWLAWTQKADPSFPFHGVPTMLVADKGSATLKPGSPCFRFVSNLGVRAITHAPGNPRAKGAIEQFMGWWERRFEALLALEPAENLAQLRARAQDMQILLQKEQTHSRHHLTRFSAWSRITQDQLRELPRDEEVKRGAASYAPTERQVTVQGIVKFDGREWRSPSVDLYGKPVMVYRDLWDPNRIELVLADDQTGPRYVAEPLARDAWGYAVGVGTSAWGEPRRLPDSEDQKALKAVLRTELPALKAFPVHEAEDKVTPLPRFGEVLKPEQAERLVSRAKATDAVRALLEERGIFELTNEDWAAIDRLPDTCDRAQIEDVVARIVALRISGGTAKEATA